ncbi:MAG: class I SAM-dependent methyltransferase, partial [Desulfotomaculales bacterium]
HKCTGVDISSEMLEIAKEKAQKLKKSTGKVSFVYGDAEKLPFPDNSFDMVVNRHLFWTLPDPERALKEWQRVLKPGGKILIINPVWATPGWPNKALSLLGYLFIAAKERRNPWADNYPKEIRRKIPLSSNVKPEKITALMAKCGIQDIKLINLKAIKNAEMAVMPLCYRMAYNHSRYALKGWFRPEAHRSFNQ